MSIRVGQYLGQIGSGGIEALVFSILEHTVADDIKWDIVINIDGGDNYGLILEKTHTLLKSFQHRIGQYKVTNLIYKYLGLFKFLKKERYDIFHIHGSHSTILIYAVIAKLAGIKKCIVHAHTNSFNPRIGPLGRCGNILTRLLFSWVPDGYLACSMSAGIWMFGKKDIIVLKNGIDVNRFIDVKNDRDMLRKKLGLENYFVVGHVGRLSENKNQSFLLDIFARFREIYPIEAKLIMVGDGEEKKRLEEKALELDISESVVFTGNVKEVERYYACMDVFVFPSLYEGLGLSLIEAQAVGLPVVASDIIVEEVCVTDLIVRKSLADSTDLWCEAIMRCRGKSLSKKERYSAICEAGYEISSVADRLSEYYRKAVGCK